MPIWGAHRAADLQVLKFGKRHSVNHRGAVVEVGEYALHLQCAWRIAGMDGIITGSRDVYIPSGNPSDVPHEFDWEKGNLRDERLNRFFAQQSNRDLLVESIWADEVGSFRLDISGGFRLEIFPDDSLADEHWRLLKPDVDEPHFVVTGSRIQD